MFSLSETNKFLLGVNPSFTPGKLLRTERAVANYCKQKNLEDCGKTRIFAL